MIKKSFPLFNFIFLVFLLCQSGFVFAIQNEPLTHGTFQLSHNNQVIQAPLLETDVKMNVSGLMARVVVTQIFKNESPNWVEGKYLFPLPDKSAVDSLRIKIGERLIIGEIKEKNAARKIYQQAKISGRKASLIEQHRPNVFSNSVANIAPFETVEIQIQYQQDLNYRKDKGFSIRFPLTMTPRYTPVNLIHEKYQDLSNGFAVAPSFFSVLDYPQLAASESSHRVSIEVELNSGLPLDYVKSQSHKIVYNKQSESLHKMKLAGFNVKTDRDFLLSWKPLDGAEPRAAVFTESKQNENYLSLMIMPPSGPQPLEELSRETIFVIDTSGSMAGESIKQAKSALLHGIRSLAVGDYFNIIEFNSSTSRLFASPRVSNEMNQREAEIFIANLNANGGTEMLPAMDAALSGSHTIADLKQVVFLTDGAISNESQLFGLIETKLGKSRLFTVGIGSAPNAFFMKKAAEFGRGTYTFVSDIKNAESIISDLFSKISAPLLSNVQLTWPVGSQVEMWPEKISDLYAGEPLWVKVKTNSLTGNLQVTGELADSLWQTDIALTGSKSQRGVAKLWAREKIASLMNQARHGRMSEKAKGQVTKVALAHQIVSRFTSLVAVDKTPSRINEKLYSKRIQQTQPKGSSSAMSYPKTALAIQFKLNFALLMIVFSLIGLAVLRGCKL